MKYKLGAFFLGAVAIVLATATTATGWNVISRDLEAPAFEDVRVCTDHVEFGLGVLWQGSAGRTFEQENLTLFHGSDTILQFVSGRIPEIDQATATALFPEWPFVIDPNAEPTSIIWNEAFVRRYTKKWAGGVTVPAGDQITGAFDDAGEPAAIPFPAFPQPPIVVQHCPVVDVRPNSPYNFIEPASQQLVAFTISSSPSFDATQINRATLKVGTSPTSAGVADFDNDGDQDLFGLFTPANSGIECHDRQVAITATLNNGEPVDGRHYVTTKNCT